MDWTEERHKRLAEKLAYHEGMGIRPPSERPLMTVSLPAGPGDVTLADIIDLHAEVETARRERDEAREDRDSAEATIARLQEEVVRLRFVIADPTEEVFEHLCGVMGAALTKRRASETRAAALVRGLFADLRARAANGSPFAAAGVEPTDGSAIRKLQVEVAKLRDLLRWAETVADNAGDGDLLAAIGRALRAGGDRG